MKPSAKLIIFLDRQKIVFCSTLSPSVTLDIPAGVIFDLEIIDPESLEALLNTFLEQNKITPSQIIIVLSSAVYFEKSFPPTSDTEVKKSQINTFLKTIPLKNIFQKDILVDNQLKLVALNREFYEPIIKYFEKKHFNVNAIIPIFVLDFLKLILVEYSPKEVKEIYKKFKLVTSYSLISAQDINKSLAVNAYRPQENRTRTLVLIVSFSFLFVILLTLLFVRPYIIQKNYTKQLEQSLSLLPTGNPQKPTQIPIATPTTSFLALENLQIKIINSSGVSNQAAKIKDLLTLAGFKKITTTTANKITGEKSQINYSSTVSQEILQETIQSLETTLGEVSSKLVEALQDVDMTITVVAKPTK